MNSKTLITPQTKVAELLNTFPQLEETLIELSPEFKKLKNPILRKTIAKVTSLQQAAIIAKIPVEKIVNTLRAEIGQDSAEVEDEKPDYLDKAPQWFSPAHITMTFDARPIIESGGHPLADVINELKQVSDGSIFELITPFIPAPLIDKIQEMGYNAWTSLVSEIEFRSYFMKF